MIKVSRRLPIALVLSLLLVQSGFAQTQTARQSDNRPRRFRLFERRANKAENNPLEWPALKKDETVFIHLGYSCSYNRETLIPNWVAYELTAEEANPPVKYKGRESFRWDPETNGNHTAYREDYKNDVGWQRGHMAPRADMRWSSEAYEETFYLSNICPQNGELNSRDWATTERMARRMATRYGSVYIVCGPIITDNKYGTLGAHKVVIPDAFFKALLIMIDGEYHSIAMVLPNAPEHHDPQYYWLTVNELEKQLHMDFFPGLDNSIEEKVEGIVDNRIWGR